MGFTLTKNFITDSFVAAVYGAYINQSEIKPFESYKGEEIDRATAVPFALIACGLPTDYDLSPHVDKLRGERDEKTERIYVNNLRAYFSLWAARACALSQDDNGYKHVALECLAYCYKYERSAAAARKIPEYDYDNPLVKEGLYNPLFSDLGYNHFQSAADFPSTVLAFHEMYSTEYDELPWAKDLPLIEGHHARISKKFPGQVSYYETPERMEIGRRLCTKPGRYLTKFYPDMEANTVRFWATQASNFYTLQFADTGDDIQAVYERGPHSCMAHPVDNFDGSQHPVQAYESPDLKLAYIGTHKKVTARALVWPDKKVVGRVYGDADRIVPLLKEAGYTLEDERNPGSYYDRLEGARLKYMPEPDDEEGNIICPYVDGVQYAWYDGEYLVCGKPPHNKRNADTYMVQSDCGHAAPTNREYIADLEEHRSSAWVQDNCVMSNYFGEWVHNYENFVTEVYTRYGEVLTRSDYIGEHRLDRGYAYRCELDDTYYLNHIPYTEHDGYKIPTLLLKQYIEKYNLTPEEGEYSPEENVA